MYSSNCATNVIVLQIFWPPVAGQYNIYQESIFIKILVIWLKRDELDVTWFFISLFNAQHVSDVHISEKC